MKANHAEEDTFKALCRAPFKDAYDIYCKECLHLECVTDREFVHKVDKELRKIGWTFNDLYIEDKRRMKNGNN